ncbi:MAG: hypothetical protein PHQ58_04260 [Rhodoferax sp.]|uniref:hypothetical protein n=1 Tax=Rhodoferax sp. TaxID=50421 RepID=UPI00263A118E|nr:hypothetical protein [Rhodoferax sp.]MDD2879628.1 hypothetical protein [Rhodoferax sp.]
MAIKDDNMGTATQAAFQQAQQAQQNRQAQDQQPQSWGFFSKGNLGGISRNPTSEVLLKAMNVLQTTYKEKVTIERPYEAVVLPVDNSKEARLTLSGIVVCVRIPDNKNLGVSYHTLLLEGSSEPLQPRVLNWNNQTVVEDRTAADVNNATYAEAVHGIVQRAFPGMVCRPTSAQVVHRKFNFEDEEAVRNLAINAVFPCISDLEVNFPNFRDINLVRWNRDSSLQLQINFNEPDRLDYASLPVRNNIAITLTAVDNSKPQQGALENNQGKSMKISQLGGFIDLIWAPEGQTNQYGVQQKGPRYLYSPRFVMTNLENVMRMTPASQLLALQTAMVLRETATSWYPYCDPRPQVAGARGVDTRNIGALNIEANVFEDPSGYGEKIDTKLATFTSFEQGKLLSATIRPVMYFSLDVSECGSDTWYNEVFSAAAAGSVAAQAAILEAANELTGGHFMNIYKSNESPVTVNDDRIHLGYYSGADGARHDIRDIDYLAVLNLLGETDHDAARAWSDTFAQTAYPLSKRLQERKKMIIEMVRGDVIFTGFARRVTLTYKFLEALDMGCREAGLVTRTTSPSFGNEYTNSRAIMSFLPQGAVAPGVSGVFQSGFGPAPTNNMGANRGYSSRWG